MRVPVFKGNIIKLASLLLLAVLASCDSLNFQDERNMLTSQKFQNTSALLLQSGEACGSSQFTLWSQTTNAGSVTIAHDDSLLYVTYNSTNSQFFEVYVWAGTDLALVPKNSSGFLLPGQFPFGDFADGASTFSFTIPLSEVVELAPDTCGVPISVIAYAEVIVDGVGGVAYAGANDAPGPLVPNVTQTAYYASYNLTCCDNGGGEEPPPAPIPTVKVGGAFAKGGWVFTTDKKSNPEKLPSLKLTRNRWGWAINVKSEGTTTYEIWANAGLNDTSKGVLVGTVSVTYRKADGISLTYNYLPGYGMTETHIYVNDCKPRHIAPGLFGYTKEFESYATTLTETFSVSDRNNDGIWIIVHAEILGPDTR